MQTTNSKKTGCAFIDDYAAAVLSGKELTDDITKRCIRYHLRRLTEAGVSIDDTKARRAAELIEKYFGFTLFPWEKYVIGLVHAHRGEDVLFRDYLIVMGTGNGKNGLISGLSWYFTTPDHGIPGYNIDIIANSEEQAKTSFNEVADMLDENKAKMSRQYYWSKVLIENKRTKSYIKFNTSNAKTKAGKRAACLIFDEVFMYPDYSIMNEFQASFGKRPNSRIFKITSQGNLREGVLDIELKKAEDVLNGENDALRMCPLIYRVPNEKAALDPEYWPCANPSIAYLPTLKTAIETDFAEIKYDAEKEEAFYTKRMNWPKMSREQAVATHEELMTASDAIDVELDGRDCIAGLDYALLSDMASVGLLFRVGDMRYWLQHSWICRQSADWNRIRAPLDEWEARGDLTIVDDVQIPPDEIARWLVEKQQRYNIKMLCLDNARYSLVREVLERCGFETNDNIWIVRPLGIASVSPVIESWFRTGALRWGDVPLLRWATNNTKKVRMKTENASGNYKYEKIEPRSRKTDPFMALVHAAVKDDELDGVEARLIGDMPLMTW